MTRVIGDRPALDLKAWALQCRRVFEEILVKFREGVRRNAPQSGHETQETLRSRWIDPVRIDKDPKRPNEDRNPILDSSRSIERHVEDPQYSVS